MNEITKSLHVVDLANDMINSQEGSTKHTKPTKHKKRRSKGHFLRRIADKIKNLSIFPKSWKKLEDLSPADSLELSAAPLTIVMAYYDNGKMLDKHFEEWDQFTESQKQMLRVIIVDDGSPTDPAEGHMRDVGITTRLFRILVDIPWHQDCARNLGMFHVNGFALIADMDHLLTSVQFECLLAGRYKTSLAYMPKRYKPNDMPYHRHPNTYLIHSDAYWRVGGYNEEFCGYYATDSMFRNKFILTNTLAETDQFGLVAYGRHLIPDASTTRYGRKGTEYHISNNPELHAKTKDTRRLLSEHVEPLQFPWQEIQLT